MREVADAGKEVSTKVEPQRGGHVKLPVSRSCPNHWPMMAQGADDDFPAEARGKSRVGFRYKYLHLSRSADLPTELAAEEQTRPGQLAALGDEATGQTQRTSGGCESSESEHNTSSPTSHSPYRHSHQLPAGSPDADTHSCIEITYSWLQLSGSIAFLVQVRVLFDCILKSMAQLEENYQKLSLWGLKILNVRTSSHPVSFIK